MHTNSKYPGRFTVTVVFFVYNDALNINRRIVHANSYLQHIPGCRYEIFFLDTGSIDNTLSELSLTAKRNVNISYLSFSGKVEKEAALNVGFRYINTDLVIVVGDLIRYPPELIPGMINEWQKGAEIVYAYPNAVIRKTRFPCGLAFRLRSRIVNKKKVQEDESDVPDFYLIDRKVIYVLKNKKEKTDFIFQPPEYVCFKKSVLPYSFDLSLNNRPWYIKKVLVAAVERMMSLNIRSLIMLIYTGFFVSVISILYLIHLVFSFNEDVVSKWVFAIALMSFFTGLLLIIPGVIGLYSGKACYSQQEIEPDSIREFQLSEFNRTVKQEQEN